MAMNLERVKVADIKPLEDEFGNKFLSRDYDLPANKDYVKALAESFGPNGEPDEPVKLIRDNGCFRIKAGNTRVRAMELLGTEECWAVIDDDDTVQSVVETVVRTNTKKKYEPLEESRFVQQLALFGDDEYVGGVASITADKAKRMRRARQIAGDQADAMSLDRLYELPDFEDDDEAVAEIMGCTEDSWRSVTARLRREKEKREAEVALRARAAELKITIVEEKPQGFAYICQCSDADDMAGDYMAASVDYKGIVGRMSDNWSGWSLVFYGEPLQEQEDPEEAERRRLQDEYKSVAEKVDQALETWIKEQFAEAAPGTVPEAFQALGEACREVALNEYWVKSVLAKFEYVELEQTCLTLFLIGYKNTQRSLAGWVYILTEDEPASYHVEQLKRGLDWVDLHIADGWQPDEGMSEFLALGREKTADLEDEEA